MSPEGSQRPDPSGKEGFAARLKQKYGEGVDPEVSLGGAEPQPPSSATSELLKRLSDHGLKSPRYQLDGEVARGGMGAILRVWDGDLRRHLAMKVVIGRADASGGGGTPPVDTKALSRFLEEAQITGQLDHPGVVPVHELGLDADGRVYFTMKLVRGRDLKAIFDLVFQEAEGWNETRALGVILKACEAMAYAHKKGVIHRDLKPANIMVGGFGEVFVMDWGLARVLGRKDRHDIRLAPEPGIATSSVKTERREEREESPDSPIVTMGGDVLGTPAYMPPEQARGEVEKLSERSDVYALGAMLYHLLARQMPYVPPGARVSNRTVLGMVLRGPPEALFELRPSLPAELVAICEKAMSRESERRYPDTLALAEDLRAYLEHRVVAAYETGAVAELRKWIYRNRPLAAAVAAALLVLVAGILFSAGKAREAEIARAEAVHKTQDVLSLSALREWKELVDEADTLWPAFPDEIAAYDRWTKKAHDVVDGRAADPEHRIEGHPSLKDHEAKLAEIRSRAVPRAAQEVEEDRRRSPSFAEWEKEKGRLLWMKRMLHREPWPTESEAEASLAREDLPSDADSLNRLTWSFVDPDPQRIVYGHEVEGLVLARRALGLAGEEERPDARDSLGWALFRCGRFDEGIAEEKRAVDEARKEARVRLSSSLSRMELAVAEWKTSGAASPGEEPGPKAREADALAERVDELGKRVDTDQPYSFEDPKDRWWHEQLAELVSDLRLLADSTSGLASQGISESHGWGVPRRRAAAATIEERSIRSPEARRRWDAAIAAVDASPRYAEVHLAPQLGLLPLGPDPSSGLFEFAELQTGSAPERGSDGRLAIDEASGLVLVLLPGGRFWLGAQHDDPAQPNFDLHAGGEESPPQEIALDAFFLSKFEMTQAQWQRFTGKNPSGYPPGRLVGDKETSPLDPVECVSWLDCSLVLGRLGLELPTEAQWEFAARAGTTTPWCTGAERESVEGAANLADQTCRRNDGPPNFQYEDWLEDGFTVHAPVGSFRPNAWGFHDVIGNVSEWCLDRFSHYEGPVAPGSGERRDAEVDERVYRGGGFGNNADAARSSARLSYPPENRKISIGVRPARRLRS